MSQKSKEEKEQYEALTEAIELLEKVKDVLENARYKNAAEFLDWEEIHIQVSRALNDAAETVGHTFEDFNEWYEKLKY